MTLYCEHCNASFQTNAKLYAHKATAHPKPTLLLMNHDHGHTSTPNRRRPRSDSEHDNDLTIVDEVNEHRKRRKYNPESDDGLTIVDEADNDSNDDTDSGLVVVDEYKRPSRNYRKLYKDCLNDGRNMKVAFERKKESLISAHNEEMREKIEQLQSKHERQLAEIAADHVNEINKMKKNAESIFSNEMKDLRKTNFDLENEIEQLKEAMKNLIEENSKQDRRHEQEKNNFEKMCAEKIKSIKERYESMQGDNSHLEPLLKAIFNCTTMDEIFKIQKLIESHQFDELIQNHLSTLQNLFLALSYGVLPICQPQADTISREQRKLINDLETASDSSAKKIIKDKRNQVVNLFAIIKESIKLARNSYNRYTSAQ